VRLTKDKKTKEHFGFVHFAERASALKAVKGRETYEIDGNPHCCYHTLSHELFCSAVRH
jgi:hypothetical protein